MRNQTTVHNLTVCLVLLALAGAAAAQSPPEPTQSEYLKSVGGGFAMNSGHTLYTLRLAIIKPLLARTTVEAEFENPADAAHPFPVNQEPKSGDSDVRLYSPQLECVINNKLYTIRIRLFQPGADGNKIQIGSHEQQLSLSLPQRMIDQMHLKLCPA